MIATAQQHGLTRTIICREACPSERAVAGLRRFLRESSGPEEAM